ncbi:hypothetical protein FO519_004211 [Halicephalobus sp. NKZ332]|nr:hypothetical protein FO519_004211 [Halicephalobus sp. NKZ332]
MSEFESLFFELEEKIWGSVQKVVESQNHRKYSVIFTGYSLGEAVVTLTVMRTIAHDFRTSNQVELFMFGESRVGTFVFANSVDKEVPHKFGITHGGDPIVHLPPFRSLGNTSCFINEPNVPSHHGTEVFYNIMEFGSNFLRCTAKDEDEQCNNSRHDNLNFKDHEYYFQHKVVSYGKNDCTDVDGVDNEAISSRLSAILPVMALFALVNYH